MAINRIDLPKEVSLPVNFFEKMKNIFNENDLRNQLVLSGDIVTYFKTSKATLEHISKINTSSPVIAEPSKKNIKMFMKLDSPDYLITGLRLRMETSSKSSSQ